MKFHTIEEFFLSAMSRGISPGDLAKESGIEWEGHSVVLTEDGTFHFFQEGREIGCPDSLVDISVISKELCDENTRNVTIPSSVTSVGDCAFEGCSGLKSVTIQNSVTSIGDEAFFGCTGLTHMTIPDGVTSIGDWAFACCSGLTSVTIPDSVTSIGVFAFRGCTGLTRFTIPRKISYYFEKSGIFGIDKKIVEISG